MQLWVRSAQGVSLVARTSCLPPLVQDKAHRLPCTMYKRKTAAIFGMMEVQPELRDDEKSSEKCIRTFLDDGKLGRVKQCP